MNTRNENSSPNHSYQDQSDRLVSPGIASLPLGRITGIETNLSYSLLLAVVGILGGAVFFSSRAGNNDLTQAALLGIAVWVAGLCIQFATTIGFAAIAGLRIRKLTIGLVGVELPVHRWTPQRTAILVIICLQVLLALGGAMWLIGATEAPRLTGTPDETRTIEPGSPFGWPMPMLGFGRTDQAWQAWQASAWLIWFQAFCQLIPMPSTLGRIGLLSLIGLLNQTIHTEPKIVFATRLLRTMALIIMMSALALLPLGANSLIPAWFVLGALAGLLWVSSRQPDIVHWFDSFVLTTLPSSVTDTGDTLGQEVRRWSRDRKMTKKFQQVREEEIAEAVDVSRLDDILDQLHHKGPDSLSDEEKQVLHRVSETLRKHRSDTSE